MLGFKGLRQTPWAPKHASGKSPGAIYAKAFDGGSPDDRSKIVSARTRDDFAPLWHAAAANPKKMKALDGLPFAWTECGVTYSSDCLAFEKNMWIISDAVDKWNTTVKNYDSIEPKKFVTTVAKPAIAGLNHLLDDGGLGDFQAAPEHPGLVPRSHSPEFLENLRSGFKALVWDKAAESLQNETHSQASAWKLRASREAIGANVGITRAWATGRLIEAGARKMEALKQTTENNPNEEACQKAIAVSNATIAAIGWGVGCLAKVNKADIVRTQGTLVNDMRLVYENKGFSLKSVEKKDLAALLVDDEPQKDMEWMASPEWITAPGTISL